jgi:tryptophan synthase alpha subunit
MGAIKKFVDEVTYRKKQPKPPFFKKLQRIGALIISTGISVALIPGALTVGLVAVGVGVGAAIVAELTTKDNSQVVEKKAEIAAELKEVTNKP